ncbi:GIY-YIG catalytic domain-containing protein [Laceyella sacchari]|jgi:excinuclease UvrABC nuclease subunit|uniref:GIY-YIG catalytic domain-containing protein n=2 Tax=Laceyella TaxID=292635 RepID=A0AA46AFP1_9BACL|nr:MULTISPECIES: GIY-YIG nuclease family protein [Laceyella]PRZ12669.1 GIY-YIG catalytic domain-containing protein [Laceyella sediminis]TCW39001.1 GIY-YIG catalytic domain-containing protein [Laceyella sacchari]SMP22418.1 GIY-YIG catalytic domain-containing protein [Laceyella tengchongensis]
MNINFDRIIPVEDVLHPGFAYWLRKHDLSHSISGLYFFYNDTGNLLYIGWSSDLTKRVRTHLKGNANTKRFIAEVAEVRLLFADSFDAFREQYPECCEGVDIEYYLIEKMSPKYNDARPRPKVHP